MTTLVEASLITIPQDRQRKDLNPESLMDLSNSIASIGLIHALVVRTEGDLIILVAGERRLKAIQTIWAMGGFFTYEKLAINEGQIPCTWLSDLDPLDAMEIELEENIRRQDLSWQDRSRATSELFELRRLQAEKTQSPIPQPSDFAK